MSHIYKYQTWFELLATLVEILKASVRLVSIEAFRISIEVHFRPKTNVLNEHFVLVCNLIKNLRV